MKNQLVSVKTFVLLILIICFVSACNQNISVTSTYTVTYQSELGTVPKRITVDDGTVLKAEQLPNLQAEGYIFDHEEEKYGGLKRAVYIKNLMEDEK